MVPFTPFSLAFSEFLIDCFFNSSQKTGLLLLAFFLSFSFSISSTYYPVKVSWDDHHLFDIVKGKDQTLKPSFIVYPFFFVGFSGIPICKGRYMQLFQRINVTAQTCDHDWHVNIKPKSGINKNQLKLLTKLSSFFLFLFLYFMI